MKITLLLTLSPSFWAMLGFGLLPGCAARSVRTAGSSDVEVLLVAGQSNALGFDARPSQLPVDEADRHILFWWRCGDPAPDGHDSTSGGRWTHLKAQPRGNPIKSDSPYQTRQYGNFAHLGGGFGPEMGFGRALYHHEKRPTAIVKVAFSGTGLRTDWNPGDPGSGGDCYRSLLAETRQAITTLKKQGLRPQLRSLVWVQGESDATAEDAPHYTRALTGLIAALRRDLDAPHLTVLVSLNTRNSCSRNPYIPVIVRAQQAAASQDPRIAYVDTSAAAIANEAHWSSAGTLEAGTWMAAALLKLEATLPPKLTRTPS
jgi:Carbohydrate esterase, sialic acid-specific acetylesterase